MGGTASRPLSNFLMNKYILSLLLTLFSLVSCVDKPSAGGEVTPEESLSSNTSHQGDSIPQFSRINASGITKLVVFIRDSVAVYVNGEKATCDHPNITVGNGTLSVSAIDSLTEHRIHEVRIYTPLLVSYNIDNCSEANLSGDDNCCPQFTLNINRCNVFHGNALLCADRVELNLNKMLMATFKLDCNLLTMRADSLQHVEVKGEPKQCTISGNSKDKVLIKKQ